LKYFIILPLGLVVVEILAILLFVTKKLLVKVTWTLAATWWQKLAADLSYLVLLATIQTKLHLDYL
jgi:hypothetical protein